MNPETQALLMTGFGALVALLNGYLIFFGSDRASKRNEETQAQQNSTDRFDRLTEAQERELLRLRERADSAETSAASARRSADEAHTILEKCQMQQAATVQAYRELREWASLPCPHPQPPPQPPLRLHVL